MRMIGLLLIALGILAFSYQGVIWVTQRESVAKVGPIEVQADRSRAIPLAPILGCAGIGIGALMFITGARRADG